MELPKLAARFKCCKCGTVQTVWVESDDIWVMDGYKQGEMIMTRDICATVDCQEEDCDSGEHITLRHMEWNDHDC